MSRIAPAGLALALLVAPALAHAQVTVPVNPFGAYLRVDPVDSAQPAVVLSLAGLGLAAGTSIRIDPQGDFDNGPGGDTFKSMFGVFSASPTLLDPTLVQRVPDALGAGRNSISGQTCPSLLPTDIPEDFGIPDTGTVVTIPAGATHLFLQPSECYFADNSDPDGDYAARISVVTADVAPAAPAGLWFRAPWPNPARERVSLGFGLPAAGRVRLAVHGVDGRTVRVLSDGALAAGRHDIAWDARDARGHAVPAGVYFARLEIAGAVLERRFAIVR